MPEALVKFGLDEALRDFCNSIESATSIKVDYQRLGIERKTNTTTETFIYRIIQELINNAVKHAQAKEILVQLSFTENKIIITVEDDGIGYELKDLKTNKGDGLNNIEYRVQYLNGKIDTITSPNNGTSVNIELNA
jgi:signal transduction histidine kinase